MQAPGGLEPEAWQSHKEGLQGPQLRVECAAPASMRRAPPLTHVHQQLIGPQEGQRRLVRLHPAQRIQQVVEQPARRGNEGGRVLGCWGMQVAPAFPPPGLCTSGCAGLREAGLNAQCIGRPAVWVASITARKGRPTARPGSTRHPTAAC